MFSDISGPPAAATVPTFEVVRDGFKYVNKRGKSVPLDQPYRLPPHPGAVNLGERLSGGNGSL